MPNNFDRGMIKWQPFNSIIPSKQMIKDILTEKTKIKKPLLSDEQIQDIENKLIECYYEKVPIKINYYFQGNILATKGVIKKIDFTYHKIYLNNQVLIFEQIISI